MSNEFARVWAEAEPIDSQEIYRRADVMAAHKVGLIGPTGPGFDPVKAAADHSAELFMFSASIYGTAHPTKTTAEIIDFLRSDDFLIDAVAQDLLDSGVASMDEVSGVLDRLKGFVGGMLPWLESELDDQGKTELFRRGYFAACQLANEQECLFEDVFTNGELYDTLHYRLEADAILRQL